MKGIEDKIIKDQLIYLKNIEEFSNLTNNIKSRIAKDFVNMEAANGQRLCIEGK